MSTDQRFVVTVRQQAYLNRVRTQVNDVRRAAEQTRAAGQSVLDNLVKGEPWRSGLSHQTPKDLWDAQAKLAVLMELAPAMLPELLRTEVLPEVVSSDRMEIVYALTEVPPDE